MDDCQRRLGAISQLFSEPVSDAKTAGWHVHNDTVERAEVICPKPRRPVKVVPYLLDGITRYNHRAKNLDASYREDGLDILDFIFGKDDLYNDALDSETSGQESIFCRSPPVRSSNPLSHDPEFVMQSSSVASSALGNSYFGKQSPRVDRSVPSCGTSYGGSPKARIEGFPSGSPECRSVVSARA